MSEMVKVSTHRKTRKVDIDGILHTIQELDGIELGQWRTDMADRVRTDSQGKVTGVTNFNGIEANLICRCLRNAKGEAVVSGQIERWPASAIAAIFKVCQEVNGMTPESEAAEKKA